MALGTCRPNGFRLFVRPVSANEPHIFLAGRRGRLANGQHPLEYSFGLPLVEALPSRCRLLPHMTGNNDMVPLPKDSLPAAATEPVEIDDDGVDDDARRPADGGGGYICMPDVSIVMESPSKQRNISKPEWTPRPTTFTFFSCRTLSVTDFVTACYIGVFAILGAVTRIAIAQLFGEECKNPGTVGWLSASAPLCVTADGYTTESGGIIFADLPSNLLGSFVMGILQDATVLGLAVPIALACCPRDSTFQQFSILHTALKTGFCGSLTTFSSWNSEMVVLIYGTGNNTVTQIWSALFGYIIGMETALGSFVCGKSVARRLHKVFNPKLAREAAAQWERQREGVYIHKELPDLERRYLHRLDKLMTADSVTPDEDDDDHIDKASHYVDSTVAPHDLQYLESWRQSTESARCVNHPQLASLLEIETCLLITHQPVPPHLQDIAAINHWNLSALSAWVQCNLHIIHDDDGRRECLPSCNTIWFRPCVAGTLLGTLVLGLVVALFLVQAQTAHAITYRTMIFAMLVAPAGAALRWKLSIWLNGNCPVPGWEWLPLGTFCANVLGSVLSIAAVALEYSHLESQMYPYYVESFWQIGSMRAIKVGFAGSLTTVSTFVAEVNNFMRLRTDHAYPYIMLTISTACLLSCLVYGWIVFFV